MKKLLSLLVVALTLVGFANISRAADVVTKKKVTTAAGVVIEITTTKTDAGTETSLVSGVFTKVTTSTGATVEIPVAASALLGATVTGVTATSAANIAIIPVNSTTALTPAAIASSINAAIPAAMSAAVSANLIPAATPAPAPISAATVLVPTAVSAPVVVNTPPSNSNQQQQQQQQQQQTETPKQTVSPDQVTSGSKP
jgi:hypothetical protein